MTETNRQGPPGPREPLGPPGPPRRYVALGALILGLLAAGTAWWLSRGSGRQRPPDTHSHVTHRPEGVPIPTTRGVSQATMRTVRANVHAALRQGGFQPGAAIFIRILKHSRAFEVFVRKGRTFKLFRTYRICTFSGELGPKLARGDFQAPEGFYRVTRRQLNPHSSYHLSFDVGYPNAYDRAHKRTGSAIMVHGNCVSAGCFAMTDTKIREIYVLAEDALKAGQPGFSVHIFPFRMTPARRKRLADPRWGGFWSELQPGYDAFERSARPPKVHVRGGRYVIAAGEADQRRREQQP